jgi:transposase
MKKYREIHQHQYQLLPPNLDELIDERHLVRVIDKFVSSLSSRIWDCVFDGGGAPSYHPQMMLKVILYAYSTRIFSCRQIARALRQDVTFMWLAGMQRPNFNTINHFRSDYFRDILEKVFTELLDLLHEQGYVSFEDYFVDGSKLEANDGRSSYVWAKNNRRHKAVCMKRVKELFCEIEALNIAEDEKYGDADLPEQGESSAINSDKIRSAAMKLSDHLSGVGDKKQKRKLESKLKKLHKKADQLEKYEQQEQYLNGRNSYSKTDKDATFMRLKDNRLRGAYNLQVSSEKQFVMNYSVSQNASDLEAYPEHFNKLLQRGQKYLTSNYVGDSAYGSEENYYLLEKHKIRKYLKYNTFHDEQKASKTKPPYHRDKFLYHEREDCFQCPAGHLLSYRETIERNSKTGFVSHIRVYECDSCSACPYKSLCTKARGNRQIHYNPRLEDYKAQARINLHSETGIQLRKRRGMEVETFFGALKNNQSFKRFLLRGLQKVEHELGLLSIAYNLRKYVQLMNKINRGAKQLLHFLEKLFIPLTKSPDQHYNPIFT